MNLYNMTDHEQELFDLLRDELVNTSPEDLAKSIKTMYPGQVLHNIRVFREVNQTIIGLEVQEARRNAKKTKASQLCSSGFRPCEHRRFSTDNTCEHYPNDHYV